MNNLKPEHQTQAVSFPDVSPSDLPGTAQFSMTAGDFLEVKREYNIHYIYIIMMFNKIDMISFRFIQKATIGIALQHVSL